MENDEMAEMLGGTRFGRGKDKKAPVTKADLPYIRCGVCEGVAKHAVAAVKTMRSEATVVKKFQEAEILDYLEGMCDPDTEAGDWITMIDLQEKDDKLQLVEMGKPGECESECRTVARSCADLMDQADLTEISEALWAGAKRAAISQTLCYEQTDACKKKPPPLPKDRMPGPPFNELDEEKLGLRRTMRGMRKSGMSGTLFDRESMMGKMDLLKGAMGAGGEEYDMAGGMGGEL